MSQYRPLMWQKPCNIEVWIGLSWCDMKVEAFARKNPRKVEPEDQEQGLRDPGLLHP